LVIGIGPTWNNVGAAGLTGGPACAASAARVKIGAINNMAPRNVALSEYITPNEPLRGKQLSPAQNRISRSKACAKVPRREIFHKGFFLKTYYNFIVERFGNVKASISTNRTF
jgi:hypothetical protein